MDMDDLQEIADVYHDAIGQQITIRAARVVRKSSIRRLLGLVYGEPDLSDSERLQAIEKAQDNIRRADRVISEEPRLIDEFRKRLSSAIDKTRGLA